MWGQSFVLSILYLPLNKKTKGYFFILHKTGTSFGVTRYLTDSDEINRQTRRDIKQGATESNLALSIAPKTERKADISKI